MNEVDDVLAHFGVKGMRWGVRKDRTSQPVTVVHHPGKTTMSTMGGMNRNPSSDAITAAAAKRVAKKSGTQALSNQELQVLVTRMNLERQYKNLQPPGGKQRVAKFTSDVLLNVGKQQATKIAGDLLSQQIAKALKK